MKLGRALALALLAAFIPLAVFAQMGTDATIYNNDGTFASNDAQTTLFLNGVHGSADSQLFGVTGLGTGQNCGGALGFGCSGTVSLVTGAIVPGGTSTSLTPLTGQTTNLAGGGMFNVTENAGAHGVTGFTFSGTFSSETWSCAAGSTCVNAGLNKRGKDYYTGSWTLVGTITGGMLTIGGKSFMVSQAVTVQLTTVNGDVVYTPGSPLVFVDNSGTTTFPSPVPEPGTLSLLGGGLIGLGIFARRRFGSRAPTATIRL